MTLESVANFRLVTLSKDFPDVKRYHQRSNVESTFSMVKAKFCDHVRSKTDVAMKNEVLCKFLCHNICCLIQSQCELGIEPTFWQDGAGDGDNSHILPMARFSG